MRILLADDHEMVRDTLSLYLTREGDFEVTTVPDFPAAFREVSTGLPYDLVMLDYKMPGMSGLEGLKKLRKNFPQIPVAILSGTAAHSVVHDAIEIGAAGFLPKSISAKSLVNAVQFMQSGEVYVPRSVLQEAPEDDNPFLRDFSKREKEVLSGLCRGMSNKEIGRELTLQEVTIKLHVRTLCRKIGAKNRTHAAMLAKEADVF